MGRKIKTTDMLGLVSASDLFRRLGLPIASATNWIRSGRIPAPTYVLGKRRVYTEAEAKTIVKQLKNMNLHNKVVG